MRFNNTVNVALEIIAVDGPCLRAVPSDSNNFPGTGL